MLLRRIQQRMNTMNEKIRYAQLSLPLKIAVVAAYIAGSIYALAFIIGFIEGIIYGL